MRRVNFVPKQIVSKYFFAVRLDTVAHQAKTLELELIGHLVNRADHLLGCETRVADALSVSPTLQKFVEAKIGYVKPTGITVFSIVVFCSE